MRSHAKLTLAVLGWAASLHAATLNYHLAGDDPGPWPEIFASIGITRASGGPANLYVVRNVAAGSVPQWMQRIEQGGIVILEGEGELAAALGITPKQSARGGAKHRRPACTQAADCLGIAP